MLLVYSTAVAYREAGLAGYAAFGWNDYFPEGTYARASYLNARELLDFALEGGTGRPALASGDDGEEPTLVNIVPWRGPAPRRHALLFEEPSEILEADGVRWLFHHEPMRFSGREVRTGRGVAWLGAAGDGPFSAVPRVTPEGQIAAGNRLFRLLPEETRTELLFEAPAGERILSSALPVGPWQAVLTDRALYLVAPTEEPAAEEPAAEEPAPSSWPLPGPVENLDRVVLAPTASGVVAVALFGRRSEAAPYPARLLTVELSSARDGRVITDKALGHGPPAWVRQRDFLVSPAYAVLEGILWKPGERFGGVPRGVLVAALLGALLTAGSTAVLARRRRLSPREILTWAALGLFLGLPAFCAFLLLTSRGR